MNRLLNYLSRLIIPHVDITCSSFEHPAFKVEALATDYSTPSIYFSTVEAVVDIELFNGASKTFSIDDTLKFYNADGRIMTKLNRLDIIYYVGYDDTNDNLTVRIHEKHLFKTFLKSIQSIVCSDFGFKQDSIKELNYKHSLRFTTKNKGNIIGATLDVKVVYHPSYLELLIAYLRSPKRKLCLSDEPQAPKKRDKPLRNA